MLFCLSCFLVSLYNIWNPIELTLNDYRLELTTDTESVKGYKLLLNTDNGREYSEIDLQNKEIDNSSATSIPSVNLKSTVIGETYENVKQNVANWVYGKNSRMIESDHFPYSEVKDDVCLGFDLQPNDRFFLILPLNGLFILRNNTFIAQINVAEMNTTVYDILLKEFLAVQPYEELITKNRYKTYNNIVGDPQLSILYWETSNSIIRVLATTFPDSNITPDQYYKKGVILYTVTAK